MKVALISTGLGHVKRGVETWTEDLGRELRTQNIKVTVYKGGGEQEYSHEMVIPCLQRMKPLSRWMIKNRPGFLWRFGFSSGYALEQMTFNWNILPELMLKQYDIIHTQDPQTADFFRKVSRMGLIRSRVILAHGTEEPHAFLGQFDYLQHLAPYHKEETEAQGFKGKKWFAIGNFIDTDFFKPAIPTNLRRELNIPADAFVVLSVAAIKKTHKRIDHLIREVASIQDENVYLVVAGAVEQESDEVIQLGRESLSKRCIFLQNFPRTRIHEVFAIADILYFKADNKDALLFCENPTLEKSHRIFKGLKELETSLSSCGFIRIRRDILLNTSIIKTVSKNGSILLISGEVLYPSRDRLRAVEKYLKEFYYI